jgi:hypothetical protein
MVMPLIPRTRCLWSIPFLRDIAVRSRGWKERRDSCKKIRTFTCKFEAVQELKKGGKISCSTKKNYCLLILPSTSTLTLLPPPPLQCTLADNSMVEGGVQLWLGVPMISPKKLACQRRRLLKILVAPRRLMGSFGGRPGPSTRCTLLRTSCATASYHSSSVTISTSSMV